MTPSGALAFDAADGIPGTTIVSPEEARRAAGEILDGSKFHPARTPKPLQGALKTLGRWLDPIGEPIGRAWNAIFDNVVVTWLFVGIMVGLAIFTSTQLVRRRGRALMESQDRARPRGDRLDAGALDRQAAEAEAAGRLEEAVRLRFVAGLLRLDRAGVLPFQPALTSGQLRRILASPTFAELAAAFDEIVYGGRPATSADIESARTGWPRVLAGASAQTPQGDER